MTKKFISFEANGKMVLLDDCHFIFILALLKNTLYFALLFLKALLERAK